jgi:hypothetical protein
MLNENERHLSEIPLDQDRRRSIQERVDFLREELKGFEAKMAGGNRQSK